MYIELFTSVLEETKSGTKGLEAAPDNNMKTTGKKRRNEKLPTDISAVRLRHRHER